MNEIPPLEKRLVSVDADGVFRLEKPKRVKRIVRKARPTNKQTP